MKNEQLLYDKNTFDFVVFQSHEHRRATLADLVRSLAQILTVIAVEHARGAPPQSFKN